MAIKSLGIDIREANFGGAGKGRYTLELTKALIESAPQDLKIFLFTKKSNPTFPQTENLSQILIDGKGLFWHLKLRRYLARHPVDLFMAPSSFIYAAIAPKKQKVAIVVHDLIAFLHAKTHPFFPTLVERLTLRRAIKKSRFLICVSKNTAQDLAKLFPEAHRKDVLIVSPAVSSDVHRVESEKMSLPRYFLLALGTLIPRKNIQGLIEAFNLIEKDFPNLRLVIAGGGTWKSQKIFKNISPTLKKRSHFLGYVSQGELNELYSRAQMLVFPSFYEGFGIPPLEAMACACPVISSNTSSLPEVLGDAALQVNPHDINALSLAIKSILSDSALREDLIQKGLKQARTFSWKSSAQIILNYIALS